MELSGEGKSVSKNRGRAKNSMQEAIEDAGSHARTSCSWRCPHQLIWSKKPGYWRILTLSLVDAQHSKSHMQEFD